MANAHILTAASNLVQAVRDVRQLQDETRRAIDGAKREANKRINEIKAMIAQHQRDKTLDPHSTARQIADNMQIQSLNNEIAQVQKNSSDYVQEMEQQLRNLDGQVNEFEGLSRRLQTIA